MSVPEHKREEFAKFVALATYLEAELRGWQEEIRLLQTELSHAAAIERETRHKFDSHMDLIREIAGYEFPIHDLEQAKHLVAAFGSSDKRGLTGSGQFCAHACRPVSARQFRASRERK